VVFLLRAFFIKIGRRGAVKNSAFFQPFHQL